MGNFSRKTFDPLKHYVNVLLQQGVPVVDSDWNEAQDIRKDEVETFLKWFVGDGVPAGSKGFEIVAVGNIDFSVADGYCLVGGWTAVNDWMEDPEHQNQPLRYSSQPLFTNAALAQRWGVDPLPPLTPPQTSRTDTVYLDVWEREVNSEGAPEIVNPAIHIETCVRTRREWVVRVWTKTEALPKAQEDPKGRAHLFYPLATIQWDGAGISTITDLRRTGLTLAEKVARAGDRITGSLVVEGEVGAGADPSVPLLSVKASSANSYVFDVLASGGTNKLLRVIDNDPSGDAIVDLGKGTESGDFNPTSVRLNANGNSYFTGGNVGIGTVSPITKLDVRGHISADGYGGSVGAIGTYSIEVGGPNPTQGNGVATIYFHHHAGAANQLRYTMGTLFWERCINGWGSSPPDLSVEGQVWAQKFNTRAADYAEFFETNNGKEIPTGTTVVLEGDKIRPAQKSESPIGVVSASPGVVGGSYREWPQKYLRNALGELIMEEYEEEIVDFKKEKVKRERQKTKKRTVEEEVTRTEVTRKKGKYVRKEVSETVTQEVEEPDFDEVDLYDETGKSVIGKHKIPIMETYEEEINVLDENGRPILAGTGKFETKRRPKLNPEYDESKEYVPREKRPEWNCVGLLGRLPLRKGQPVAESWIKLKDLPDDVELWLVK